MTTNLPTILIPIEIVTRELTSKLLLASALAAEGFRTVVGHKEAVSGIGVESKGVIWHGKSLLARLDAGPRWGSGPRVVDSLLENESAVLFHQEEGGIFARDQWE